MFLESGWLMFLDREEKEEARGWALIFVEDYILINKCNKSRGIKPSHKYLVVSSKWCTCSKWCPCSLKEEVVIYIYHKCQ